MIRPGDIAEAEDAPPYLPGLPDPGGPVRRPGGSTPKARGQRESAVSRQCGVSLPTGSLSCSDSGRSRARW